MLTKTEVWWAVEKEIRELLLEEDQEVSALTGQEHLVELGLSSLMLARLVIQLEMVLGVDPFAEDIVISDIRSVDDLAVAYERTLASTAKDNGRNSDVA